MCRPAHKSSNCLDLVFTDTPGVVACSVGIPIGSTDHCYVFATNRTEQYMPDVSQSSVAKDN